jgi:hypothetical protein
MFGHVNEERLGTGQQVVKAEFVIISESLAFIPANIL